MIYVTITGEAEGQNITNFYVPLEAREGETVLILCVFDLKGKSLYTLKWYKEEHEFYRIEPKARPRRRQLPVQGISVDVSTFGRVR